MSARRNVTAEEALALCASSALRRGEEDVPLGRAQGRTLSRDARALIDHPPFRASAMDGFAVRSLDTPGRLEIAGESRAGAPFATELGPGGAVVVSTGAIVPSGADAVVPLEDAQAEPGRVRISQAVSAGAAVRPAAEDLVAGDVVLAAGARVRAHQVAALAASGNSSLRCRAPARLAILITGEEVVPPGAPRGPSQIFDASGPGITAQALAAGAEVVAREHVGDDPEATRAAVARLLSRAVGADLLVSVGGASVGGHDHVPSALAAEGLTEVFRGVEVRPGHPLLLAVRGSQAALALPGNPVSAAVCFHAFGRALLGVGAAWLASARLAAPIAPTSARTELVRARWVDGGLEPLPRQASHAVSSLAGADALVWVPAGGTPLAPGSSVRYAPLDV